MKSNKMYQPPSGKAEILFLVCIALFAAAALFFSQPILAAAEGVVFLILLAITLITKRRERQPKAHFSRRGRLVRRFATRLY